MAVNEIDQFWMGASKEGRNRYKHVKLIGSGAYSVVARAEEVSTGERVAIKRIGEVFYDALEAKKVTIARSMTPPNTSLRLPRHRHRDRPLELAMVTPHLIAGAS